MLNLDAQFDDVWISYLKMTTLKMFNFLKKRMDSIPKDMYQKKYQVILKVVEMNDLLENRISLGWRHLKHVKDDKLKQKRNV